MSYTVGVDVGTGSVRAALCDGHGGMLCVASRDIDVHSPHTDYYEQSSHQIWDACVYCIKEVCRERQASDIVSIGFDATCSLVVLDKDFKPLSVTDSQDSSWNVMMWMDHRAVEEAEFINKTKHPVLNNVGGKISLEMQTPKLLWLKRHNPVCWDNARHYFDLPDFLTWKATHSLVRSLCSLVCKWTYQVTENSRGWSDDYFTSIGLPELIEDNYSKIGSVVSEPGCSIAGGLCSSAALELGLTAGTTVATSMIDAHAGAVGLLATQPNHPDISADIQTRLALICGTSTCHMAVSCSPVYVRGVWGPYCGAIPGYWLTEGGQSAAGRLVDHIIDTHPAKPLVQVPGRHIQDVLVSMLESMSAALSNVCHLTTNLHVLPDFHGNRSPMADPQLKGMICGLTLDAGKENLALLYLATLQALAYGTRHIISELNSAGHNIQSVFICGGLSRGELWIQTHADALQMPVCVAKERESVLLGANMLARAAHTHDNGVQAAMRNMGGGGTIVHPNIETKPFHEAKYKVFLKMLNDQLSYREIMGN